MCDGIPDAESFLALAIVVIFMAIDHKRDGAFCVGVIILGGGRPDLWRFGFLLFDCRRWQAFGDVQIVGDVADGCCVILAPDGLPEIDQITEFMAGGEILADAHLVFTYAEFKAFARRAVNIAAMKFLADIYAVRQQIIENMPMVIGHAFLELDNINLAARIMALSARIVEVQLLMRHSNTFWRKGRTGTGNSPVWMPCAAFAVRRRWLAGC